MKVEIEWDLPLMRQPGKVKMLQRRGFLREIDVGFSLPTPLSKTNLADTLSECLPNWPDAYGVTKKRGVPCVL